MEKSIQKILCLVIAFFASFIMAPQAFAAPSDDEAVTVYVSISDDGEFVKGIDGTVMAHVPFKISYFDLAEYGLSDYYRYEAAPFDEGGEYISTRLIKEPTLLHLYIKLLEKYYTGRKLTAEDVHSDIINVTGSPTHLFLEKFWGHSHNFMYFVDHAYPLQAEGWGATCDYIILYDGTEIDVGMFTDIGFNTTGASVCFDRTDVLASEGEDVTLTMLASETKDGGGDVNAPVKNEPVRVSEDRGRTWDTSYGSTDSNGEVTLNFDSPGTYYVSAGPKMVNYPSASGMPDTTPPISVVTVTPREKAKAVETCTINGAGIKAPSAGSTLTLSAECSGAGVREKADIVWYDGDTRFESAPLKGHTYTASITLKPASGYKFTSDTKVTMNGEKLAVKEVGQDGTITVIKKYPRIPDPVADAAVLLKARIKAAGNCKTKVSAKALPKHKAKVTWKKAKFSYSAYSVSKSQYVTGYKIYRATKKTGKYKLVKTLKKASAIKFTDRKLKKGKKYFYKVRPYTVINGKTYLGKLSGASGIKAK